MSLGVLGGELSLDISCFGRGHAKVLVSPGSAPSVVTAKLPGLGVKGISGRKCRVSLN